MKFKEFYLLEVSSYNLVKNNSNKYSASFNIGQEQYKVDFEKSTHGDHWFIAFQILKDGKWTDSRVVSENPIVIYKTLFMIVTEFLEIEKPKSVWIGSSVRNKQDLKRMVAYDMFVKKIVKKMPYEIDKKYLKSGVLYSIINRIE